MRASDRRRLFSYVPKIELTPSDLRPKGSAPLEQIGTQVRLLISLPYPASLTARGSCW